VVYGGRVHNEVRFMAQYDYSAGRILEGIGVSEDDYDDVLGVVFDTFYSGMGYIQSIEEIEDFVTYEKCDERLRVIIHVLLYFLEELNENGLLVSENSKAVICSRCKKQVD